MADGFYRAWIDQGQSAAAALQAGREAVQKAAREAAKEDAPDQTTRDQDALNRGEAAAYGYVLIGNPHGRFKPPTS
jgi:hypothetical protein